MSISGANLNNLNNLRQVQLNFKGASTDAAKAAKTTEAADTFNKQTGLPEGKALLAKTKTKVGMRIWQILLIPFGFFGISVERKVDKEKLELIDFDRKNPTKQQKKLYDQGRIITKLPEGYELKGDTAVRVEYV